FATGKRGSRTIKRKIAETHSIEEPESASYLFEDFSGDFGVASTKPQTREESQSIADSERADVHQTPFGDFHCGTFRAQPSACTGAALRCAEKVRIVLFGALGFAF